MLKSEIRYGVLDTKDKVWMGNGTGPLVYNDEEIAMVSARCIDVMMKWPAGRCRAVPYDDTPKTKKDEVEVQVDAETALKKLEKGEVL